MIHSLRRSGVLAFAVASAISLSACNNAQFEDGFNKGFAKSAKSSCLKSAKDAGAEAARAEAYCTCFVDRVSAWTTQEKMSIDPKSEKFKAVMAACLPG